MTVRRVIIVGGGSTGWMAAAYLSRFLPHLELTVVEAPDVPPLVVGESTNAIARRFNHAVGLEERSLLRAVDGTYKVGIRFDSFSQLNRTFYHPFGPADEATYWSPGAEHSYRTRQWCTVACVDPAAQLHGYHVDAGRYGTALRTLAMARGVRRVERRVQSVLIERDRVASVEGIAGDLFIDCSGFRRVLLGGAMHVPFVSIAQTLLNDSAVALRVPYERDRAVVDPFTTCTALSAGWAWKIPLWSRIGAGYCYSSAFIDSSDAEWELRHFLGEKRCAGIDAAHIKISHGRLETAHMANVIALGPAHGFIEPLESTGIALTQRAIIDLAASMDGLEKWAAMSNRRFDTTVDFVQAHYVLSRRDDTAYWRAARKTAWTPGLARVLRAARCRSYAPIDEDAGAFYRAGNWNAILSGMGVFGPSPDVSDEPAPSAVHGHSDYLATHVHGDLQ